MTQAMRCEPSATPARRCLSPATPAMRCLPPAIPAMRCLSPATPAIRCQPPVTPAVSVSHSPKSCRFLWKRLESVYRSSCRRLTGFRGSESPTNFWNEKRSIKTKCVVSGQLFCIFRFKTVGLMDRLRSKVTKASMSIGTQYIFLAKFSESSLACTFLANS